MNLKVENLKRGADCGREFSNELPTMDGRVRPAGDYVSTPYGNGRVTNYRVRDSTYTVELDWTMADDHHAQVFLQPCQMQTAFKAAKGDLVCTTHGLGTVLDHRDAKGKGFSTVYVVKLSQMSGEAVGYFNADAVICKVGVLPGQRVFTPHGEAIVLSYNGEKGAYSVLTDDGEQKDVVGTSMYTHNANGAL